MGLLGLKGSEIGHIFTTLRARLMKRNVSIPQTFQLCDKKKSFSSRLLPSVFFLLAPENLGERQKEKSEQQRNVRRDSKGRRRKIREIIPPRNERKRFPSLNKMSTRVKLSA